MRKFILYVAVAAFLVGCGAYKQVKRGEVIVMNGLTVTSTGSWNRFSQQGVDLWTMDGAALQGLTFLAGVKDGEVLPTFPKKEGAPTFNKSMTLIEMSELVRSKLSADGFEAIEFGKVDAVKVGEVPAIRLEATLSSETGLKYRALALGAIHQDRLYLTVYTGTDLHYFERGLQNVQQIFDSMQFV